MNGVRKERSRAGRAGKRLAGLGSPLPSLAVALSLLVQLVFVPYHQASGTPALSGSDATRIAAGLRAIFGDTASLCVRVDDKGAPAAPVGQRGDECPFCRFAAEAAALVVPDIAALPVRFDIAAFLVRAPPEWGALPAGPPKQQQARAPPVIV